MGGPACRERCDQAAKQIAVAWKHLTELETDAQAGNDSFGDSPRAQGFMADLDSQPPEGAQFHLIVWEKKQAAVGADVMQIGCAASLRPDECGGYFAGHSKPFYASLSSTVLFHRSVHGCSRIGQGNLCAIRLPIGVAASHYFSHHWLPSRSAPLRENASIFTRTKRACTSDVYRTDNSRWLVATRAVCIVGFCCSSDVLSPNFRIADPFLCQGRLRSAVQSVS